MKTICFVNMKGGVAKTTLAINFADCLRRVHGKKVALIDIDPQFNATQCLLNSEEYIEHLRSGGDTILSLFDRDESPQVSVLAGSQSSPAKELSDIALIDTAGLSLLPGNIDLYRVEMTSGEGREFILKRYIDDVLANEGYDFIIIDTPPTPSIWMTSALIASDHYIIPVKPDPLSIIGIDLLKAIIARRTQAFGLTISCLGVVFTLIDRPDSVNLSTARSNLRQNPVWRDKLIEAYLPKRTVYAREQLTSPFILSGDDFDFREDMKTIANELIQRL